MMDETYLLNAIKEQLCYVSPDFRRDLTEWKRDKLKFQMGYVLPDHKTNKLGRIVSDAAEIRQFQKEGEHQVLALANERFAVPEALFNPSDVDLDQAGLAEAVAQSITSCRPEVQPLLWANIVLTGGTALLRNFETRLEGELRLFAPEDCTVRVRAPDNPLDYAWHGGSRLGQSPALPDWVVTREEYQEIGESACIRKFGKNPGTSTTSPHAGAGSEAGELATPPPPPSAATIGAAAAVGVTSEPAMPL